MRYRSFLSVVTLLSCALNSNTFANSIILNAPAGWNGWSGTLELTSGFRQTGDPTGLSITEVDNQNIQVIADAHAPGEAVATSATTTIFPDFGELKDIATINASFTYNVGSSPSVADTFDIELTSTTSAENAFVDFGAGPEAADSFTELAITLVTNAPLFPAAGFSIDFPESITLTDPTQESFASNVVSEVGGAPYFQAVNSGTDLASIPLEQTGVQAFTYQFIYNVTTPFGVDPTFSYSVSGSIVPEPGTATLLLLSSSLQIFRRRR